MIIEYSVSFWFQIALVAINLDVFFVEAILKESRNSRLKLPGDFVNFSRRKEFRNIRETEEENKRFFIRSITPIIRQIYVCTFHLSFSVYFFLSSNSSMQITKQYIRKMNFWNKIYIYINSFVKYLLLLIKNFNYQSIKTKQILLYFNFSYNFEPINFEVRTRSSFLPLLPREKSGVARA